MNLSEKVKAKLVSDHLFEQELATIEALKVEKWHDKVFRHLWDMPEHETVVLEITARGKISRINKVNFKEYLPPKGAYVLLIETENNDRSFRVFQNQATLLEAE